MSAACILGCAGTVLSPDEAAFFRELNPWGFILFARNIEGADQTRRLIDDLRAAVDDEAALAFVDQEGGRVQRLRPPLALRRRPAALFGELYRRNPEAAVEAVKLNHQLIAYELAALGFDADCAPCIDLPVAGAHDIIGDRAFGKESAMISALGRAAVDGLLAGGVAPVIKHIPGHGRACADSHLELPVVDTPLDVLEETDFAPFRALADAPMAMTAHVTYSAIDPDACATVSHRVIETVIRGHIGFDGLLMSDDLSMKALGGTLQDRARRSIEAGCDVTLHGNGALVGEPVRDLAAELTAVAEASPELTGRALERAEAARAVARRVQSFDPQAAEAHLASLGLEGRGGMKTEAPPELDFEAAEGAALDGQAFIIDLDGFEGPLHILLALARSQKVDLLKLSITELADQYLAFVREARAKRFALAADYLVMASWLAYLKSRLLLPKPERAGGDEMPADELAATLAFRIVRLDAMRRAVEQLKSLPQLGLEVFVRGDPEAVVIQSDTVRGDDLYGLMRAFVDQRRRESTRRYRPKVPTAYPLEAARTRLRGMIPELDDWTPLAGIAPAKTEEAGPSRASYLASTLSAGLEMVKEGALEARQLRHFADVFLKAREGESEAA